MKEEQLALIKEIVDKELQNNRIKDLLIVKKYINDQIYEYKKNKLSIVEEDIEYDILILDLMDFINIHIINPDDERSLYKNSIYNAVKKIKGKDNLKVSDLVGIGSEKMLKCNRIGQYTVDKIEEALEKFGYSLDEQLTKNKQKTKRRY